jgi:hypothetical protein
MNIEELNDLPSLHARLVQEEELTTTFHIGGEESKNLSQFLVEHNKTCKFYDDGTKANPPGGAIGGRLTYSFTPTTIGMTVSVKCACGAESNITDYGSW